MSRSPLGTFADDSRQTIFSGVGELTKIYKTTAKAIAITNLYYRI